LRAIAGGISGWWSKKTDRLQENQYVMGASYDKAIASGKGRLQTVRDAVAVLIGQEKDLTALLKTLGEKMTKLEGIKSGAKTAMQHRLDDLLKKGLTKEQIQLDADFMRHNAAFTDANKELAETKSNFDEKDKTLKSKQAQIAKYKVELQGMQRDNEKLKDEKSEALADVAIAKQSEEINAALAGISEDTTGQDLEAARAARKRVVNRAEITAELAGNDVKNDNNEYLNLAQTSQSNAELDKLLNWGEGEKKEDANLAPAKLPE
jgi:phage shock protein A